MDGNPLISVIVPIYMIDSYLGVCIESILHQTYQNMEIILVDDGGMDLCAEICDLYAKKDHRIKVIHKMNGGLVSARKTGLREANGEYVFYVDGDDWIGAGFIESLYTVAHASGADMVCAGHSRDLFGRAASFVNPLPAGIYEGTRMEELWKCMISYGSFYRPGITTYVWNKMFRKDVVLHPQLAVNDRISIGEDAAVTYPALLRCGRVVVTGDSGYHYRQREGSMLKRLVSFDVEAEGLALLYEHMFQFVEGISDGELRHSIEAQVIDYILSVCIIRSGGMAGDGRSLFGVNLSGRHVAVYSAGTFGQQIMNRLKERRDCEVAAWVDDDYWEYRRCCMDVDPVESLTDVDYDYILIAAVSEGAAAGIRRRLHALGVNNGKIRSIHCPQGERKQMLDSYLGAWM